DRRGAGSGRRSRTEGVRSDRVSGLRGRGARRAGDATPALARTAVPRGDERAMRGAFLGGLAAALTMTLAACADRGASGPDALAPARLALSEGRFAAALELCVPASAATDAATDAAAEASCEESYCALLARTMLFVGELNDFLLPNFRSAEIGVPPGTLDRYVA